MSAGSLAELTRVSEEPVALTCRAAYNPTFPTAISLFNAAINPDLSAR
ncbi:MAG: hypothetical protein ACI4OY_01100 [Aristaeellaceae bacterium]